MRIAAFARLAAGVATALIGVPAFAYAPPALEAEEPVLAPPVETMRPTTGGKGGLAPRKGAAEPPEPWPADPLAPTFGVPGLGGEDEPDLAAPGLGGVEFEGRARLSDVRYGEDGLPAPVAERRRELIAAAKTGRIEALRPVFAGQAQPPVVAALEAPDDPVDVLRSQSGDAEGREILAIMIELLDAGYVEIADGAGTTYVWPYFAEVPLTEMTPAHLVELYRVLTAVDVEDMIRERRYAFFRIGISADGRLRYFTAGEVE